ncbi:MAG: ATP-binding protein [Anaerolineae bacterium]|nr:ATP-binding protein [Anaerolineae bacterium]
MIQSIKPAMIHSLKFTNFKNFQEAKLICGPLTLLMGTNASGKSNVRDAFRFLHGIGRRYTLAEIVGEKYGPGGELVWDGIRGGVPEIAYCHADHFALEVAVDDLLDNAGPSCVYRIEIAPNYEDGQPQVVFESLCYGREQIFEAKPISSTPHILEISVFKRSGQDQPNFNAQKPALTQFAAPFFGIWQFDTPENPERRKQFETLIPKFIDTLGNMRFLDISSKVMRQPSTPGQRILGDRGEHLASVLQTICADPQRKAGLLSWLRSLTPMDVADLRFIPDFTGKVMLVLIESGGQETSAYSASEGTLRLLVMLAALLGPQSEQLFFFEELENGIHPSRLHLLLELIEKQVARSQTQVIATTHSPQLLRLISPETLENVSLVYRLEGQPDGHIRRLVDLPESAKQVLQKKDITHLYESGWFENVVSFLAAEDEV